MEEYETFSTRLIKGLKYKIKLEAAKRDIKSQELVSEIINEWFEKNNTEKDTHTMGNHRGL